MNYETVPRDLKGELQRENKLTSYERAFKMLETDMYIAGIGQAVLELSRQVLFDLRAGNSNLAKSLSEKSNHAMYQDENHTDACYPCKINKNSNFSPILVTSIHKTDSFRL